MKIAVTGGAEFIGSNVVDELIRNNHEVYVIYISNGETRSCISFCSANRYTT